MPRKWRNKRATASDVSLWSKPKGKDKESLGPIKKQDDRKQTAGKSPVKPETSDMKRRTSGRCRSGNAGNSSAVLQGGPNDRPVVNDDPGVHPSQGSQKKEHGNCQKTQQEKTPFCYRRTTMKSSRSTATFSPTSQSHCEPKHVGRTPEGRSTRKHWRIKCSSSAAKCTLHLSKTGSIETQTNVNNKEGPKERVAQSARQPVSPVSTESHANGLIEHTGIRKRDRQQRKCHKKTQRQNCQFINTCGHIGVPFVPTAQKLQSSNKDICSGKRRGRDFLKSVAATLKPFVPTAQKLQSSNKDICSGKRKGRDFLKSVALGGKSNANSTQEQSTEKGKRDPSLTKPHQDRRSQPKGNVSQRHVFHTKHKRNRPRKRKRRSYETQGRTRTSPGSTSLSSVFRPKKLRSNNEELWEGLPFNLHMPRQSRKGIHAETGEDIVEDNTVNRTFKTESLTQHRESVRQRPIFGLYQKKKCHRAPDLPGPLNMETVLSKDRSSKDRSSILKAQTNKGKSCPGQLSRGAGVKGNILPSEHAVNRCGKIRAQTSDIDLESQDDNELVTAERETKQCSGNIAASTSSIDAGPSNSNIPQRHVKAVETGTTETTRRQRRQSKERGYYRTLADPQWCQDDQVNKAQKVGKMNATSGTNVEHENKAKTSTPSVPNLSTRRTAKVKQPWRMRLQPMAAADKSSGRQAKDNGSGRVTNKQIKCTVVRQSHSRQTADMAERTTTLLSRDEVAVGHERHDAEDVKHVERNTLETGDYPVETNGGRSVNVTDGPVSSSQCMSKRAAVKPPRDVNSVHTGKGQLQEKKSEVPPALGGTSFVCPVVSEAERRPHTRRYSQEDPGAHSLFQGLPEQRCQRRRPTVPTVKSGDMRALSMHACVLWSSENKRHYQLQNPGVRSEVLDSIMRDVWDQLPEQERSRYYQRAANALNDRSRLSRASESNRHNYSQGQGQGHYCYGSQGTQQNTHDPFHRFSTTQQQMILEKRLCFFQRHLPHQEYDCFIRDFMVCFRETVRKSLHHGTDSPLWQLNGIAHQLLYSKIKSYESRVHAMQEHANFLHYKRYKQKYDDILWGIITGDHGTFDDSIQSKQLTQLLLDLENIESSLEVRDISTHKSPTIGNRNSANNTDSTAFIKFKHDSTDARLAILALEEDLKSGCLNGLTNMTIDNKTVLIPRISLGNAFECEILQEASWQKVLPIIRGDDVRHFLGEVESMCAMGPECDDHNMVNTTNSGLVCQDQGTEPGSRRGLPTSTHTLTTEHLTATPIEDAIMAVYCIQHGLDYCCQLRSPSCILSNLLVSCEESPNIIQCTPRL